jgi:hypothetical protein
MVKPVLFGLRFSFLYGLSIMWTASSFKASVIRELFGNTSNQIRQGKAIATEIASA